MSRPLRIIAPGLTYHVRGRGNGRMPIYLNDRDRDRFIDFLAETVAAFHLVLHAWCQMTNHYHLLFTTRDANLSRAMKHLNGEYARWWNHRHDRIGHVFHGRFAAKIVQGGIYLLTCATYLVRNPVRKGLVQTPDEWRWSSYRATAGLAAVPSFLTPETVWGCLGGRDHSAACALYRDLANSPDTDSRLLDPPVVGDPEFVARFNECRRQAGHDIALSDRRVRPPLQALFASAATRKTRTAQALVARAAGYSIVEIARFLELHASTVSKMLLTADGGQT